MSDEPDLFDFCDLKYVRGSETSLEAALAIEPTTGTLRWRVLHELRKYPNGLTDHQMQELIPMNPSTQRPRRVELVRANLVKKSGYTRITPSGRQADVWVAV